MHGRAGRTPGTARGRSAARRTSAAIAAAALVVAACSSTLDEGKIEQAIGADLQRAGIASATVDCPGGRTVQQGDAFTCTVRLSDGGTLTYDVTQTSGSGDATYKLAPDQLVLGPDVARDLQQKVADETGSVVEVRCPPSVLTPGGRATMRCTVSSPSEELAVDVDVERGRVVTWQVAAGTTSTSLPAE